MTVPKSISENDDLLSTADVAKELGVHRSTVHGWIKNGMLPSELHGAFHAVKPADLKRFRSIYNVEAKANQPDPPKKTNGKKRKRKRGSK